jgi:flagellar biogenesis protein FliO
VRIARLQCATASVLLVLSALPAIGQTAKPAPTPTVSKADQAMEDQPLRISDADSNSNVGRTAAAKAVSTGASELSRIAVALVIVIGVILLLRSAVRHMTAMPGTGRGGKLVTVLSRSVVSPRQQVLVLQVGKRLIVVGDSGGRMNALCEITDPDEIAMMVGQNHQARDSIADRNPKSFLNMFRRANEPFTETEALAMTTDDSTKLIDPNEGVSSEEMNGLMDKVRMLQEQFRAKA